MTGYYKANNAISQENAYAQLDGNQAPEQESQGENVADDDTGSMISSASASSAASAVNAMAARLERLERQQQETDSRRIEELSVRRAGSNSCVIPRQRKPGSPGLARCQHRVRRWWTWKKMKFTRTRARW